MKKYLQLFILAGVVFVGVSLLRPQRVNAGAISNQLAPVAPTSVANYVEDRCVNAGWSLVQTQWISPRGAPTSTTANVSYGASSVPLQLNFITYRCKSGSSVTQGSFIVVGTSPDIPALTMPPLVGDMNYAGVGQYVTGDQSDFDYVTGAPFVTSGNITITYTTKGIISSPSGSSCAIWNPGDYGGPVANNRDFARCAPGSTNFTVFVSVGAAPPGTISGRVYQDSNSNGNYDSAGNGSGDNSGVNGEEYIQDPGAACGPYLKQPATISITSDPSSPETLSGCNPQPYYRQSLSPGTYTVSVNLPSGWVATGPYNLPPGWTADSLSSATGPLNSGDSINVWFGIVLPPPPTAPAPTITRGCDVRPAGNFSDISLSWQSDGSSSYSAGSSGYQVFIDDNNFASGYWLQSGFGSNSGVVTPPFSMGVVGAKPTPLILAPGRTYQVKIHYEMTNSDSQVANFVANKCPPKVTQSCSGGTIVAQVSWPNVDISTAPHGWDVNVTDDPNFNSAGWFLSVPNPGGAVVAPYTVKANLPPVTSSWGGKPAALTLTAGIPYLFRIAYRDGAGTVSQNKAATFTSCASPILTCSSATLSPTTVEANPAAQPFTVSFSNDAGPGGDLTGATLSVSADTPSAPNFPNVPYTVNGNPAPPVPAGTTAVSNPVNILADTPGTYTVTMTITGGNTPGGTVTCPLTLTVAVEPYFKVYGGDISAGGGWGSNCAQDPNAKIIGWNQDNSPSFYGAGTQFGALASDTTNGVINGFTTAQGSTPPAAYAGLALSFANSLNNSPGSDTFGGQFGSVPCIHDFYADKPAGAPPPVGGGLQPSGTYFKPFGTYAINAATVPANRQITIYVNGNVRINGNVVYGSGRSLSDPANLANGLPSFRLIVRGNIYISSSVTQLDGLYVAQPTSASPGTTGIIYTCSSSSGFSPMPQDANFYTNCNTPLAVNGSLIAQRLDLLRTSGSLSQSPGDSTPAVGATSAAEYVNYTPELWIGSTGFNPTPSLQYDAVTSLPPVL